MLEQPLECKDPTEALSKHSPAGFTYTHAGAVPCDTTRKVLPGSIGNKKVTPVIVWLDLKRWLL